MANTKSEKSTSKRSTSRVKAIQLKIGRTNPDNVRSVPVNDVVINHSENEFFITFSSVEPPVIFSAQDLSQLGDVDAIARAKIVVSPEFLEVLIKALSVNLESYKQRPK